MASATTEYLHPVTTPTPHENHGNLTQLHQQRQNGCVPGNDRRLKLSTTSLPDLTVTAVSIFLIFRLPHHVCQGTTTQRLRHRHTRWVFPTATPNPDHCHPLLQQQHHQQAPPPPHAFPKRISLLRRGSPRPRQTQCRPDSSLYSSRSL